MRQRALLSAIFGAFVAIAVALGLTTPLPTSAVWSNNVWVGAKITTRASSSTTYLGGLTPGTGTKFSADPVWTVDLYNACTILSVTTDSTVPVTWSVKLDTAAQPWNNPSSIWVAHKYRLSPLVDGRYRTISGDPDVWQPVTTVTKGTVLTFQLCANPGPPPVGDSSWMEVRVSAPTKVSEYEVCKTVTATALNKTPFWFRWRATVPTADMFDLLSTRSNFGWTYPSQAVVRDPEPSTNPSTPSTVVLTSATYTTDTLLKDDKRYDYTMCLKASS